MRTSDFDFDLPPELIAQSPAPQRDQSRLLVLHRRPGKVEHRHFRDLVEYLRPGDVLVLNNSRVIPARLRGVNARTGGRFEVLLLEENSANDWWVMLRPGKRAQVGTQLLFQDLRGQPTEARAVVLETNTEGHRRLRFSGPPDISDRLDALGEVPLPPYISREDVNKMEFDRLRYQTVYAQPAGSVAAPTAGLHFTEALLRDIRARGVQVCFLTLHVGLGTFAPVKAETILSHTMHEERYTVSEETARAINAAKAAGHRVLAVGTTTVRVLETLARLSSPGPCHEPSDHPASNTQQPTSSDRAGRSPNSNVGGWTFDVVCSLPLVRGPNSRPKAMEALPSHAPLIAAGAGKTRIFLYPPCEFKIVDVLLTNFHLPRSTLLMLVSAFAKPNDTPGRELVLSAYAQAIRERYRFFSYGDAMLIL